MTKKTICIDFDGVIHAYSKGWHDGTIYDTPTMGVWGVLEKLSQDYKIVVLTARARTIKQQLEIKGWLSAYDLLQFVDAVTNIKPAAVAYIDDKAVSYTGNWNDTMRDLERLLGEGDGQ